jgi:4-aminobutyrate aminotransferase-like enzyme
MNVKARDRRFLARDEPPDDLQVTRSDGNYVYDANAKKYIDFFMGWCVGNMGWGHRRVRKAVRRFTGPEYVSPTFVYKPWIESRSYSRRSRRAG